MSPSQKTKLPRQKHLWGSGETSQLIKCLSCKHESLRSDPKRPLDKNLTKTGHSSTYTGEAEENSWSFPANLGGSVCSSKSVGTPFQTVR